jgi:CBS domain-containing protein
MKAAEIMTRELISVKPEYPQEECLRLIKQNGFSRRPVLEERQSHRSMLSVSDILNIIASDEETLADLLESFVCLQRC